MSQRNSLKQLHRMLPSASGQLRARIYDHIGDNELLLRELSAYLSTPSTTLRDWDKFAIKVAGRSQTAMRILAKPITLTACFRSENRWKPNPVDAAHRARVAGVSGCVAGYAMDCYKTAVQNSIQGKACDICPDNSLRLWLKCLEKWELSPNLGDIDSSTAALRVGLIIACGLRGEATDLFEHVAPLLSRRSYEFPAECNVVLYTRSCPVGDFDFPFQREKNLEGPAELFQAAIVWALGQSKSYEATSRLEDLTEHDAHRIRAQALAALRLLLIERPEASSTFSAEELEDRLIGMLSCYENDINIAAVEALAALPGDLAAEILKRALQEVTQKDKKLFLFDAISQVRRDDCNELLRVIVDHATKENGGGNRVFAAILRILESMPDKIDQTLDLIAQYPEHGLAEFLWSCLPEERPWDTAAVIIERLDREWAETLEWNETLLAALLHLGRFRDEDREQLSSIVNGALQSEEPKIKLRAISLLKHCRWVSYDVLANMFVNENEIEEVRRGAQSVLSDLGDRVSTLIPTLVRLIPLDGVVSQAQRKFLFGALELMQNAGERARSATGRLKRLLHASEDESICLATMSCLNAINPQVAGEIYSDLLA